MKRLEGILQHALDTVPYYRSYRRAGHQPRALTAFPPIGKREYVANLDALLSTSCAAYERTRRRAEAGRPRTLLCEFTSGSSGYPLHCYKTSEERTQLALSLLRKRKAIDPSFTMGSLFGFIHAPDYPSTSHLDGLGNLADENIGRVLSHLRDSLRPAFLHGNPMLLLYYARYMERQGFDLGAWQVRFIESVSEPLSDEDRAFIAAHFRTRVVNCYGCLEVYNIAYECPLGRLHQNENVIVEILDPTGDADWSGRDEPGEVVLTSLVNRAQPFVRYRTGDLARKELSTCGCGDPRPVLVLTGRRKVDYVKLLFSTSRPGLTICGYDIFYAVMSRLSEAGHDALAWFNVVQQELDRFEVQYISKSTIRPDFFDAFHAETEREIGGRVRLAFVEKSPDDVLFINRKNRVFRSLLQVD